MNVIGHLPLSLTRIAKELGAPRIIVMDESRDELFIGPLPDDVYIASGAYNDGEEMVDGLPAILIFPSSIFHDSKLGWERRENKVRVAAEWSINVLCHEVLHHYGFTCDAVCHTHLSDMAAYLTRMYMMQEPYPEDIYTEWYGPPTVP